jgi:ribonuclease BN (tRNA processing enzyme)
MSHFSLELPINSKNSISDVIRLAYNWIVGSPHSEIQASQLDRIPEDSAFSVEAGKEVLHVANVKAFDYEIGGIQLIKLDGGLQWTTSIVGKKFSERLLVGIDVNCIATNTVVALPPPKKPYFIRQALSQLGGGFDGQIPVADRPYHLNEDEISVAAALLTGSGGNRLPIVYVSASFDGTYLVDSEELARYLSGMAHVVVEPTRRFSFRLKDLVLARNVFGGTVGVYWPESQARKAYFLTDEISNSKSLQQEITKDIRVALANRRLRTDCTWLHLQEILATQRLDRIKSQEIKEQNEFIDAFDAEIAVKDARILENNSEIARLNAEVRRLSSSEYTNLSGLLLRGSEQDLYENEIRDIVIDALENYSRSTKVGTRRNHVMAGLLAANPSNGAAKLREKEIKSLFKTYRDLDSKARNTLARLGFDLSEEGKHYKIVFQGDGRYTFSFSKTSSDHRAGLNIGSDLSNLIF